MFCERLMQIFLLHITTQSNRTVIYPCPHLLFWGAMCACLLQIESCWKRRCVFSYVPTYTLCVCMLSEAAHRAKGDALDSCALLWQVCRSRICISTAVPCLRQDVSPLSWTSVHVCFQCMGNCQLSCSCCLCTLSNGWRSCGRSHSGHYLSLGFPHIYFLARLLSYYGSQSRFSFWWNIDIVT